mmetsp:Transcript_4252/g.5603  ORF Transcript_4252/g.5603 Transcript_4252/m.5603 type:complete len:533 (-) Transcript_4252:185-1783(-)|eukprot:CAMPEP_0198142814 /NCGR_PEP_ID=MMETSP1443-20131203/5501_1 /TAXON_ID=186043 /ORGANISM="Entomoneis sp., Strain CCMP2396" /LENGTH=532 /DNA_ID=CAMNT_0043805909 /DNA_START=57 /DNA_END=1655 /DNA_ORIENTATION=-
MHVGYLRALQFGNSAAAGIDFSGSSSQGENSTSTNDDSDEDSGSSARLQDVAIFLAIGVAAIFGLVFSTWAFALISDKLCCCCPWYQPVTDAHDFNAKFDRGPVARKARLWGLTIDDRLKILTDLFQRRVFLYDTEARQRNQIDETPDIPLEEPEATVATVVVASDDVDKNESAENPGISPTESQNAADEAGVVEPDAVDAGAKDKQDDSVATEGRKKVDPEAVDGTAKDDQDEPDAAKVKDVDDSDAVSAKDEPEAADECAVSRDDERNVEATQVKVGEATEEMMERESNSDIEKATESAKEVTKHNETILVAQGAVQQSENDEENKEADSGEEEVSNQELDAAAGGVENTNEKDEGKETGNKESAVDEEKGKETSEKEKDEPLNEADHERVCCICLNDYEQGDELMTGTSCNHKLHFSCCMEWMKKQDHCPYCRQEMLTPLEMREQAITTLGQKRVEDFSSGSAPPVTAATVVEVPPAQTSSNPPVPEGEAVSSEVSGDNPVSQENDVETGSLIEETKIESVTNNGDVTV